MSNSVIWRVRLASTKDTLRAIQDDINALCRARKHYRIVETFETERLAETESSERRSVHVYDYLSRYPQWRIKP